MCKYCSELSGVNQYFDNVRVLFFIFELISVKNIDILGLE